MWFLFLTTVLPSRGSSGGEIVSRSIVDALRSSGSQVRVAGYRRPGDDSPAQPGEIRVGERPIETAGAGPRALVWLAVALTRGAPYSSAKYRSRKFAQAVRERLAEGPAAVFVDHAQLVFTLDLLAERSVPVVFIAHNAEAESYAGLAASAGNPAWRWIHGREARLIERAEADLTARASQIWTLTGEDAAAFRRLQPEADVRTLEVASAVSAPAREDHVAPACDIALIGTWSWRPNLLGLRWFSEHVVPLLPGDVRIEVAGRGAEWLAGRHPNVMARGVVSDAQEFLAQARVIAVPSVAGSGVQIKTLDAIASGAPVVATPVAVRGLGELPRSVAVAGQPDAFAAHLGRLVAGKPAGPDPDAISWTEARRARFREAVLAWSGELVHAEAGSTVAPSLRAGRST